MRLRQAEFIILQQLRRSGAFPTDEGTVHLMLSGGKDSVALLEVLSAIALAPASWSRFKFEIVLHHFNHKQRGEDSDSDEELCVDVARKLGWPLERYLWNSQLQDKVDQGENFQSVARAWRYGQTTAFAKNWSRYRDDGSWVLATAHHRRDHAETLLHNLARGCGPAGLLGMKPWTPELKLLRPFLWLTCEQLDACVAEKRLPHREDQSNQSREYTRNRLRHDVLGELAKINPQVVEHLWSLSGDMASLRTSSASRDNELRTTNNEAGIDKIAKFKIRTAEISGLQALGNFLEPACEEHQTRLSRGLLNNLLDHVHKLAAGRNRHQRYIFSLSEKLSLVMTHKHLEIKVTS